MEGDGERDPDLLAAAAAEQADASRRHDPYQDLLDEAQSDQAVEQRTRERWLRVRAEDGARLEGVLADLAERRAGVVVRTTGGARHRGTVTGVAIDHVTIRGAGGDRDDVHLALDTLVTVRPDPSVAAPPATGERPAALDRTLHEVLARAVGDRPRIVVVPRGGGAAIAGVLVAVGADVASIHLDGSAGTVYLNTATIAELTVT